MANILTFRYVALLFLALGTSAVYAQETVMVTDKLPFGLAERYHVLKANEKIKDGTYQAYLKKTAIASGMYRQGKKVGTWHFFDPAGKIVQHYNYDRRKLIYEAAPDTAAYNIKYDFDKPNSPADTVTRAVKIGGIFYGLLPYVDKFKIDNNTMYSTQFYYGVMQLLVSPFGRLADCRLLVRSKRSNEVIDTYVLDPELLTEEEKTFIPATVNGHNVSTTIYIYCHLKNNFKISIY